MDIVSVTDALSAGLNHCLVVIDRDQGALIALLTAGLVGGVSHCAGMCGPFALTQVAARLEATPIERLSEWRRLTGAALLPYHLGRATTYAAIGAVSAGVAGHVGALPGLRWLSVALLVVAALFFLGQGLRGLGVSTPWLGVAAGGAGTGENWWSRRVGALARPLFAAPFGWRGYGLGLALGFIPCGLVYGAVAVAAATGDAVAGAIGMAAFALGTVPALLAVAIAGHLAGRRWRPLVARIAPAIMTVNAGVLGWMAWRLV